MGVNPDDMMLYVDIEENKDDVVVMALLEDMQELGEIEELMQETMQKDMMAEMDAEEKKDFERKKERKK